MRRPDLPVLALHNRPDRPFSPFEVLRCAVFDQTVCEHDCRDWCVKLFPVDLTGDHAGCRVETGGQLEVLHCAHIRFAWCGFAGRRSYSGWRGRDTRRPQTAAPSPLRRRRRRCPGQARLRLRRIPTVRASASSLHTAGHRRFKRSRDLCHESPPRAPACRWRYPRTGAGRRDAIHGGSPRRPDVCRRRD